MENIIRNNETAFMFQNNDNKCEEKKFSKILANIFTCLKRVDKDILIISDEKRIKELYEIAIDSDAIIQVVPLSKIIDDYSSKQVYCDKIVIVDDFLGLGALSNNLINKTMLDINNDAFQMFLLGDIGTESVSNEFLQFIKNICSIEFSNNNLNEINAIIADSVCIYNNGTMTHEFLEDYFVAGVLRIVDDSVCDDDNESTNEKTTVDVIDSDIENFLSQETNNSKSVIYDEQNQKINIESESVEQELDSFENELFSNVEEKANVMNVENINFNVQNNFSSDVYKNNEFSVSKEKVGDYNLTIILAALLGFFGVHRFINGKIITGLIMLLTLGGLGIWWIVDIIVIFTGNFNDKNMHKIIRNKEFKKNVGDIVATIILIIYIIIGLI